MAAQSPRPSPPPRVPRASPPFLEHSLAAHSAPVGAFPGHASCSHGHPILCPLSAGSHFLCALLTPKTGRNSVSLFLNAGHWRPWCSKSRGHKLQATCSSGQGYRPNGRLGTCPTRTSPLRPCVVSLPPVFQDCHPVLFIVSSNMCHVPPREGQGAAHPGPALRGTPLLRSKQAHSSSWLVTEGRSGQAKTVTLELHLRD